MSAGSGGRKRSRDLSPETRVATLQNRVPRSMGTTRVRSAALPPFRVLTRRLFVSEQDQAAGRDGNRGPGRAPPGGTPYHVIFRQQGGAPAASSGQTREKGKRRLPATRCPLPHLVSVGDAEHPHFQQRGVLRHPKMGPCVVCMDLTTVGKRDNMQVQVVRMQDLLDTDERTCPIACEDFDKAEVDGLPAQGPGAAASPSEFPEHCVAVLPCNHLFSCIPLLYYMATESMRCPICRAGHGKKRLRVSCLPEALRDPVNAKIVASMEEERAQLEVRSSDSCHPGQRKACAHLASDPNVFRRRTTGPLQPIWPRTAWETVAKTTMARSR